jgi:hypothetical protein
MPVEIVNNYSFPKKKQIENIQEEITMSEPEMEIINPAPVIINAGQFPALSTNLHDELNSYLGRSKEAVEQILVTTREKAEFLETLAEKARKDLEKEKHDITRLMGV